MSARVSRARLFAFDVLWRVEAEAAYAGHLLTSERGESLARADRALAYELALGVLRSRLLLDFLISRYARRPVAKLDPEVAIALRLGLYQLRFLSRIPAHAAINESVNLAREKRRASAAPMINAALRAAQREAAKPLTELTAGIEDPIERMSVEMSHPRWLIERWLARYGEDEARALAAAGNQTPRVAFRFNERRAPAGQTRAWFEREGIIHHDSALVKGGGWIEGGHLAPDSEPVREGWIYLQDEASQLVAHVAAEGLKEGGERARFLDLCAAPGSKTTLISSLLPRDAVIVGADLHHHRLLLMRELARRLHVEGLHLVELDASKRLPFREEGEFDGVLLDAPCSGLGTLARHPEIKWRMTAEKVSELAGLQRRLIERAAGAVRRGGLLTYSVCSTEPEEGEEVVAWLRSERREFRDVTRERLIEIGLDPAELLTPTHGARTFTHRHGTESFFFCALWKRR